MFFIRWFSGSSETRAANGLSLDDAGVAEIVYVNVMILIIMITHASILACHTFCLESFIFDNLTKFTVLNDYPYGI